MRRRAVAVGVALVLVAGCGGDDDGSDGGTGVDIGEATVVTGGPGTLGGGPPTAPAGTAADGSTTTAAPPPPTTAGGPSGTAGGGPTTATTDGGGGALDADVPAGGFAGAYLRPDRSERIVVEVHADRGPGSGTVDHVVNVLADVTGKPVSAAVAGPPGGRRDWTQEELVAAADRGATTGQGGGVAVVRLLFVRGTYEGDAGVLGVAVRGDVAAVFLDGVDAAGGLLGAGARSVEVAVATHEVGHLLGLVDLALDTGRDDPEHPGHSRNRGSVMYWAVESDLVAELLGAAPPTTFDADDRADLAAIAGG